MPQPFQSLWTAAAAKSAPDDHEASNASLVHRFLSRDENAFAELFRRHRDLVYAVCMGRLRHHQDAEDLTQETFRRVAVSIDHWDSARPLEPWLVRIARNRCRTFLSRRRQEVTGADWSERSTATPAIRSIHAEAELVEEVQKAIEELPEHLQTAFVLIHQEGWSYDAVSRHLKRPVGTVKTNVHRARLRIIERLRQREAIPTAPTPEKRT